MSSLGKLRAIKANELELMRSWRNEPDVRKNMYTQHEISNEEHMAWWSRTSQRDDQKYFMYERSSTPLGIVGFTLIDQSNSNCSWAFYSAPGAPRGTGSRMEFLALEYVFGALNMHKLYCEVLAFNTAVIKLHQKFGFKVEGILRQQYNSNDEYIDIIRLGLLEDEWMQNREKMQTLLNAATRG